MKRLLVPITPDRWQSGILHEGHLYPRAAADSPASYCRNLHLTTSRQIVPVENPTHIGDVEGRIVGIDRQSHRSTLFSQTDEGKLCIEGYIYPDGTFTKGYCELVLLQQRVISMAHSGTLVVMSLEDGTPVYLYRDGDDYVWLGEMPQIPVAYTTSEAVPNVLEATIEAYDWGRTVSDLRPGIPSAIKTELGSRVLQAYAEAKDKLHALGLWHNPVAVRIGYRLYDGSLLCVSAPVPAGLDRGIDYCPAIHLSLTPAFDEHNNQTGYCGTGQGTLQLHGYRLHVSCPEIPTEWCRVISAVEVYVCDDPEGVNLTSAPEVTLRQMAGSGYTLVVRAKRRSTAQSYSVFSNGVWHLNMACNGGDQTILYRNPSTLQSLALASLSEQSWVMGRKARMLLCHDDMLHLAGISRVSPLPLPGGYASDPLGNATVEPLTGDSDNGVARFAIPPEMIVPTATGINLHAPLLMWHSGVGVGAFRLRVMYEGVVYECLVPGVGVQGEDAWMYLSEGGTGLALTPTELPGLQPSTPALTQYPGMVMTMQRGNPLVAVSHTISVGGRIEGMAAQCIGGGAYTRQYIYLFTHMGITALTHNYTGVHTNCRTISPEHVSNPERMTVATSHGVYTVCDSGSLMQLNDSRCNVLFCGMGAGWKCIGWDGRTDELWICHDSESMVLQCGHDLTTHVRDCSIDTLLQCGTMLFALQEWRLLSLYGSGALCTDCEWIETPEVYQPGVRRTLNIPLPDASSMHVNIEQVAEDVMPWEDSTDIDDTHRAVLLHSLYLYGIMHRPLQVVLHPLSQRRTAYPSLMRVKLFKFRKLIDIQK